MSRDLVYNSAAVALVWDGIIVDDLAEDVAIEVQFPDDATMVTQGLDSASTSFLRKTSGVINVYVRPTSTFLDTIYTRYYAQTVGLGAVVVATLQTGVQEFFTFYGVSISKAPDMTESNESMQKRQIVFKFQSWTPPNQTS